MTIVTLTLNPTLDQSTSVDLIEPWHKLRCDDPQLDPGGGGINVARVVAHLGGSAIAVAALGGHVGTVAAEAMTHEGIDVRRVAIRGHTRQSFSVWERTTSRQYRFVHSGPRLTPAEWRRCLAATIEAARSAHCVVVSGSVPPGVPGDAIAELARQLASTGVPLIVDTSGPALMAAMRGPAWLVKPSLNELRTITGDPDLVRRADIEDAARKLMADGGCEVMAVSLGAEGALVVPSRGEALMVHAPSVRPLSSIGAGDSMVGGIAFAFSCGRSLRDVARFGVACGTAAVLQPGTALCALADVDRLLPQVVVEG
jgi:6-phosphofructokinase 2